MKEQHCISYYPPFTKFSYFRVKTYGFFSDLFSIQKHKCETIQPFHQALVLMTKTILPYFFSETFLA